MLVSSFNRWKGTRWILMPLIVGLLFTGMFPVSPGFAANKPAGLDPDEVRKEALGKGLKSLREAIQKDAREGRGQLLILNPKLKRSVPLPDNLDDFLNPGARKLAAQLGKALFWDMAIGSDGNACASCHFAAGADPARAKNQLTPDFIRIENVRQGDIEGFHFAANDPDFLFQLVAPDDMNPDLPNIGPNYTLKAGDFPFVKYIGDGDNVNVNGNRVDPADGNTNDVASSMGVFLTTFFNVAPNSTGSSHLSSNPFNPDVLGSENIRDNGNPFPDVPNAADPAAGAGFMVADKTADEKDSTVSGSDGNRTNVRRVEPRHTPSTINAVFNLHNFWDGRANFWFNGVTPFGKTDREAEIFVSSRNRIQTKKINMKFASLASQAVGPPLSPFEMSFTAPGNPARNWPDIGKKMVNRRALATQFVHENDSLLGKLRADDGMGLTKTYSELIKAVFKENLWDSSRVVVLPNSSVATSTAMRSHFTQGAPRVMDSRTADRLKKLGRLSEDDIFTQMEANFSFFFGVAVMLYEAELVADDSPFDRFMAGNDEALGQAELRGLKLFMNKGRCINCHGGPELSNASVRNTQAGKNFIEPMIMGNRQFAFYDNGFYNIGVTPTTDDVGRGGKGPGNKPLASSRQFLFKERGIDGPIDFPIIGNPVDHLEPGACLKRDRSGKCVKQELFAVDVLEGEEVRELVCIDLNMDDKCGVTEDDIQLLRVAVDGAFKTPMLRGVELTGPYMHNGGFKTLLEVVEFYDRGGNFCGFNIEDLDPDIEFIGFEGTEEEDLVKFLISLTDERVRLRQAPFDNPEIRVPNGHPGDEKQTEADGDFNGQQAKDEPKTFEAVGKDGVNDDFRIQAFHTFFGSKDGLEGHMEAGIVDSSNTEKGAPKCNRDQFLNP